MYVVIIFLFIENVELYSIHSSEDYIKIILI